MKKSLIALAVLAASGASFAQSSVTVYGLVDLWVGSVDDGATSTTKMGSGGVNGSRWGMKGSEDLGGGLKANFQLEQGIAVDTGLASGFTRQSWVGFSGGFGEVRIGNTATAYDDVAGTSHAVFDSALSPTATVFGNAYVSNPNNMFYYQAPDFGGISGAISYSLKESTGLTNTSFNLTYAGGPLGLQLGYQVEENSAAPADIKLLALGATYAFGPATLKASYGDNSNGGNVSGMDSTDWQIGGDYAISPALTVSASYAKTTFDSYGVVRKGERSGYGIGAAYTLSKRTFLYGGYRAETDNNRGAGDVDTSLLAVGVQHKF